MKKIEIKKGHILQRKGDLNSRIYQVEAGLLRSYSIDEKGKEHIFMFGPEGWIVADNLPEEQPSELFIDALEDSVVHVFEKDFSVGLDTQKLIRRLSVLQKRVIMLMSASSLVRYEHFLQTYPDISQRVPQKMIASYLGITPEALSKIRGEQTKQK